MLSGLKRFIFGEDNKQVSPRNLLKPLRACMENSRKQMPNGTYNVHNRYTIHLSDGDYTQLKPLLNDTRLQLEQYLKGERDKRKYGPKGWQLAVEIVRDENLKVGNANITSVFAEADAQSSEPVADAPPDPAPPAQQDTPEADPLAPTAVEPAPLPATGVEAEDDDEDEVAVKTVLVGDVPETEIVPQRRGQLTVVSEGEDGQTFNLIDDEITVGREGNIVISDHDEKPQVSRQHFTLTYRDDAYVLTDTSANGTAVNGDRVSEAQVLADGDVIQVGGFELRYTQA
jgi:hypothetical protein